MKAVLLTMTLVAASASAMAGHTNTYWNVQNVGTGRYDSVSSWWSALPAACTPSDTVPTDGYRANFVTAGFGPAYSKFTDYRITFPAEGLAENSITHMRGVWAGDSFTFDTVGTWWLKTPGFINGVSGTTSDHPLLFSRSATEGQNYLRLNAAGAGNDQYGFLLSNAVLKAWSIAGNPVDAQRLDLEQGLFNWYDPMGHTIAGTSVLEVGYGAGTDDIAVNFHSDSETRGKDISLVHGKLNILGGTHEVFGSVKIGDQTKADMAIEPELHISGGTLKTHANFWIGCVLNHPGARLTVDGTGRLEAASIELARGRDEHDTWQLDAKAYMTLAGDSVSKVGTLTVGSQKSYTEGSTPVNEMVMSNNATLAISSSMTVGASIPGTLKMSDSAKINMGSGAVFNIAASRMGRVELTDDAELNLDAVGVAVHSENSAAGDATFILGGRSKLTCPGVDSDKIKVGHYQCKYVRMRVQDDAFVYAPDAIVTMRGTNTIFELAGGATWLKGIYTYGADKEGHVCGTVVSGGYHTFSNMIYAANAPNGNSRGFFKMTGGTVDFASVNADLRASSSAGACYGRVELLGGTLIGRVNRSASATWTGNCTFYADGGTIQGNSWAEAKSIAGFETAKLGSKGLTITNSYRYVTRLGQAFTDAVPGTPGLIRKTGNGTMYVYADSSHGETIVEGSGTMTPVSGTRQCGRSLVVRAGAMLDLTENEGAGFSAETLTLGDAQSSGTLKMAAGDVMTLTADDPLTVVNGILDYAPAATAGTYTLFRCKGAVDLAAFNLLSVPAVPTLLRYTFVSEADGDDTLVKLVVAAPVTPTDNVWRGTDGEWTNAANWAAGAPSFTHATVFTEAEGSKNVTLNEATSIDSMRFTGGDYTIDGSGKLMSYSLSVLAGYDVIGTKLMPFGAFVIDVATGATLDLTGELIGRRANSVTKTGSGALGISNATSSVVTDWKTSGGRTTVQTPESLGTGSALTAGPATLTIQEEGEMSRNVTVDAGDAKAAILDVRDDVKVTGYLKATSGGFVKRGAGSLSFRYPYVGGLSDYDLATSTLGLPGGDYRPSTRSKPITFDPSGDFTPDMTNGLGGINVLAGTLRLEGQSVSAEGIPLTRLRENCWTVIGGEWDGTEANAELELSRISWLTRGGYGRVALGVKVPAGAPNRPTLRVIDGSYMTPHGIFLGDADQGQDVYPTLAVTNATVEIPYHFYVGPLNTQATNNHPTVRLGAGGRIYCSYPSNYERNVLLGENCDVDVADGGVLEVTNAPYGVSFGEYASGAVVMRNGGSLKIPRFQGMKTSKGGEDLVVAFDGGILEMLGDNTSVVASPDHWTLETRGAGLELRAAEGVSHVFTLPLNGTGTVVKTGAGTIEMALGQRIDVVSTAFVTNASGLVTANWTGLTEVREGTLVLRAGAVRGDLAVKVCEDGILDLSGETVSLGAISGSGRIQNGKIRCTVVIPFGATTGYDLPEFDSAVVGRVIVDFSATGDEKIQLGTVIPVARLSGSGAFNPKAWRGVNMGKDIAAQFTLVDGVVYATAIPKPGMVLLVR